MTSTAMILPAPTIFAAWMVLRPTPPQPQTATLAPGGTLARLKTGPAPASTPHDTRHATSSGASLRIGITLGSGSTVCVAYPATWRKTCSGTPLLLWMRLVPSSMNQRGLSRSAHIVGWPPMQYAHRPHDGMYDEHT